MIRKKRNPINTRFKHALFALVMALWLGAFTHPTISAAGGTKGGEGGGSGEFFQFIPSLPYCNDILGLLQSTMNEVQTQNTWKEQNDTLVAGLKKALSIPIGGIHGNSLLKLALERGQSIFQTLDTMENAGGMVNPGDPGPYLTQEFKVSAKFEYFKFLFEVAGLDQKLASEGDYSIRRSMFEFRKIAYAREQLLWLFRNFVTFSTAANGFTPAFGVKVFVTLSGNVTGFIIEDLGATDSVTQELVSCPLLQVSDLNGKIQRFLNNDAGVWPGKPGNYWSRWMKATKGVGFILSGLVPELRSIYNSCQFVPRH